MVAFKFITLLVVTIYGILLIYGAFTGLRGRETNIWANIIMIVGSLFIIFGTTFEIYNNNSMFYVIGVGLMLIHIAMINHNYKIFNTISIRDNILVICISSIILITYYIGFIR